MKPLDPRLLRRARAARVFLAASAVIGVASGLLIIVQAVLLARGSLGDPWLYNEYVDGRKMNGLFQNHQAARELSAWLLTQAKGKK